MAQQSFRQVFVTNNPSLLAQGQTVDKIAVGQIGLLDGKTHAAVTVPTYATTKAFEFVWGTPDLGDLPMMAGVPNANIYSKLIKGKYIKGFRGKKAKKAQNQIVTVGYSGDASDVNTLFANPGESRKLYLTLTGGPIDKLFSKQGITRVYGYDAPIVSDCTDTCSPADPRDIANSLVNQINSDNKINRFIKASPLFQYTGVAPSIISSTVYVFNLTVADTQDDVALGLVQSQYVGQNVTRVSVQGPLSTYSITSTVNSLPAAYVSSNVIIIPDCSACPSGYTSVPNGYAYVVLRQDAGTSAALTQVNTDYNISETGESTIRLAYQYGQSTYVVVSVETINAAVGTDIINYKGVTRNSCVLTSPVSTNWSAAGTLTQYGKQYTITLGDNVCGTNRLSELQAFYSDLTVTIVNASGSCLHTYQTIVYSNAVPADCNVNTLTFVAPQGYDGIEWSEIPVASLASGTTVQAGIKIEVAYINRITNECTFDYFPYEFDTVFIHASSFDPNYNDQPLRPEWVSKQIQATQFAAGFGAHVRTLEKESKSYELLERSFDPIVREVEGYKFQAQPYTYYDEYVLDFSFEYKVGGWSQDYIDHYSVSVFFPAGTGKAFETAINSYLASANINIDPVVL